LVHFTFWYILPRKIWQPCERLIPFRWKSTHRFTMHERAIKLFQEPGTRVVYLKM
jgi:hypothetical protein